MRYLLSLSPQVGQLQRSKEELETINDSLQAQLEEHMEKVQLLQEEQVGAAGHCPAASWGSGQ